jgi:hypothetical protein
MGDLTIHCATCHAFDAQVSDAPADSVQLALRPQREECLSCHAMRARLTDFPLAADDPHGGTCGACHDPHAQTEPAQAFDTCTGCHAQPDTLTPFHRGLDAGVLQTCARCHTAHGFHADGTDCRACHTGIPAATPVSSAPTRALRMFATLLRPGRAAAQQAPSPAFDHAQHAQVECVACHDTRETHGGVTVATPRACRACHHTEPVVQPCVRCHAPADYARSYPALRPFTPSVGDSAMRRFPFEHRAHADVTCGVCHSRAPELSAARIDCAFCHEQHHDPETSCIACHDLPAPGAHTRAVHLSCAGSGCHSGAPVSAADRTRSFCLGCHQDLTDHQPGRRCEDCHALPAAQQAGGGAP